LRSLIGEEVSQLLEAKDLVKEEGCDEGAEGGASNRHKTGARLCGICRKSGYNAGTCLEAEDIDDSSNSAILNSIECFFRVSGKDLKLDDGEKWPGR
jgi:hypothetical protein